MPPECAWCEAEAVCLVEVEPQLISTAKVKARQARLPRQLPACAACRGRLASRGYKHFPVTAAGWYRYWQRHQGRLF